MKQFQLSELEKTESLSRQLKKHKFYFANEFFTLLAAEKKCCARNLTDTNGIHSSPLFSRLSLFRWQPVRFSFVGTFLHSRSCCIRSEMSFAGTQRCAMMFNFVLREWNNDINLKRDTFSRATSRVSFNKQTDFILVKKLLSRAR